MAQKRKKKRTHHKPKTFYIEKVLKDGRIVGGEVYNVKKMFRENIGDEEWIKELPSDWYEYRVWILAPDGTILHEWDSRTETYNGSHRLTFKEAKDAVKEIINDCLHGKCEDWFDL